METEFNTEFPSHRAGQGKPPVGYTGPFPTTREMTKAESDPENSSSSTDGSTGKTSSGNGSGSSDSGSKESGDPDAKYPERVDSTGDGTPDDHGNIAPPPTLAAWTARIVTVGLLISIIAYLIHLCLRDPVSARFDIALGFDKVEQRGGTWVLPVDVTNASTESMGNVTVEVTQGDTTRSFELLLMGEGEKGDAEVTFPLRPTEDNTDAQVVSYVSP